MFGAPLDAFDSFRTHQSIPPKNEVEVQPAKKLTNFGQNLGQMYKKAQSTLGKAKGAKKTYENRLGYQYRFLKYH